MSVTTSTSGSGEGNAVQYTLWTFPWGPFPRRVTIYLREKRLPSHLAQIKIVECGYDLTNGTYTDDDERPRGTFPVLKVHASSSTDLEGFVKQSSSIIEYFEDAFPGYNNMRGSTPLEKARVRDILNAENDVLNWINIHGVYGSKINETNYPLSPSTSRDALKRTYQKLHRLEALVCKSVLDEHKWLAGTDSPSIADCAVASDLDFAIRFFETDLLPEDAFPALSAWFDRFEQRETLIVKSEMPPSELQKEACQFNFDRAEVKP